MNLRQILLVGVVALTASSLLVVFVSRYGLHGLEDNRNFHETLSIFRKRETLQTLITEAHTQGKSKVKMLQFNVKGEPVVIRSKAFTKSVRPLQNSSTTSSLINVTETTNSLSNCTDIRFWPQCGSEDASIRDFCNYPASSTPDKVARANGLNGLTDNVKYFVHFIGHPRSGSSIVGAVLDGHPNALVCSSEYYALHRLETQYSFHSNRENLYTAMALFQARAGFRCRKGLVSRKGYATCLEGMGVYKEELAVVGDKLASQTVSLYMANHTEFGRVLLTLGNITGAKMKFIQVIRNPFDNIATRAIYFMGNADLRYKIIVKGEGLLNATPSEISCVIKRHFNQEFALKNMVDEYKLDVHQVHLSDLIARPQEEVVKMCSFLQLQCDRDYLRTCEKAMFQEASHTRHKVAWTNQQIDTVHQLIQKFDYLQRYSFDSV